MWSRPMHFKNILFIYHTTHYVTYYVTCDLCISIIFIYNVSDHMFLYVTFLYLQLNPSTFTGTHYAIQQCFIYHLSNHILWLLFLYITSLSLGSWILHFNLSNFNYSKIMFIWIMIDNNNNNFLVEEKNRYQRLDYATQA